MESMTFMLAEKIVFVTVLLNMFLQFLSLFLEMFGQLIIDIIEERKN